MPRKNVDAEELLSALGLLVRKLRAEEPANELSLAERLVVARLAKEGAATTAGLARAEGVKPQSMGATVAALEAAGLVRRTPHPTDGRQSLVALSARGAAVRERIRGAKRAWLALRLAALDPHERETLSAATEILARMVQS